MKAVATNRKARRNYQVAETCEAGIELKGNEVKSLRAKGCSLEESFARIEGEQAFLYNMHISEFEKSCSFKPKPKRRRKLLLHKKEIKRLLGITAQRGLTLIPLKVYFNVRGFAKVELGLAKGRKIYDKRRKLKEKAIQKDSQAALKKYRVKI